MQTINNLQPTFISKSTIRNALLLFLISMTNLVYSGNITDSMKVPFRKAEEDNFHSKQVFHDRE